ncbi:MAG: hypothetical protein KBD05_01005 [Candidatus Pacebacteria bacterium]|nr:hypothetical protein [Candidatus Paceibacterota bacterium]
MPPYKGLDRIPGLLFPGLYTKSKTLYDIWSRVCHAAASLTLLGVSNLLALSIGFDVPLYVFLVLVVWVLYKEFYLDPKSYGQKWSKGVMDSFSWLLPFVLFFLFR